MKNLKDPIRNRIHDLPACSAMPQPTTLPATVSLRESNRHSSSIAVFLTRTHNLVQRRLWPLEGLVRLKKIGNFQYQKHSGYICPNHIRKAHDRLYMSVFGRSCDRPSRHRFFSLSLCLKANSEMVPKIPSCHYMLLM